MAAQQQSLSRDELGDTLSTYRHLRLAMALLLGLLLTAVFLRAFTAPGICFEGSISAYYYTSARAVFVGALCALGTCLIVYRGNTDAEDVTLNASGALAFVVAFVPTGAPMGGKRCSASNVPSPEELQAATNNNMAAFMLLGLLALVVAIALVVRSTRLGNGPKVALFVFGLVLAAGILAFVLWPAGFREHAHLVAAVGTFFGILGVVGLNAWGAQPGRYRTIYGVIAGLMALTAAGIWLAIAVTDEWDHAVFVVELLMLVLFLAFWVAQTLELWRRTSRHAPALAPPP
ncbi:MAG TPA: hypothetical protein VJ653_00325 [Acidimicrobiales bacterium]|nr:hypothetical protein [Acidimicrobiales bacterium]